MTAEKQTIRTALPTRFDIDRVSSKGGCESGNPRNLHNRYMRTGFADVIVHHSWHNMEILGAKNIKQPQIMPQSSLPEPSIADA